MELKDWLTLGVLVITAAATGVLAWFTWALVKATRHTAVVGRQAAEIAERAAAIAERQRADEAAPRIVVELSLPQHSAGFGILATNAGRGVALDVWVNVVLRKAPVLDSSDFVVPPVVDVHRHIGALQSGATWEVMRLNHGDERIPMSAEGGWEVRTSYADIDGAVHNSTDVTILDEFR